MYKVRVLDLKQDDMIEESIYPCLPDDEVFRLFRRLDSPEYRVIIDFRP